VIDYLSHFRRYADAYTRSLGDRVDTETIRGFFAEEVLALGTNGTLHPAKNDASFDEMLTRAYAFYKAVGTRRMSVERVEVSAVYENHDAVRVFYVADYERSDGTPLSIRFDLCYLVQRRDDRPLIFAFVAGDEMALYREHGLVDADGAPT
jgi:hypothetical protein